MEQLHEAIVDGKWERALNLALAFWRDTRTTELADIIDLVGPRAQFVIAPEEPTARHAWWIEQARDPNSIMVGTLLAWLGDRTESLDDSYNNVRARWTRATPESPLQRHLANERMWPSNFQERFALLSRWRGDDPRIARTLVRIIEKQLVPRAYGITELYDLIGDKIGSTGDRSVTTALDRMAAEPRASDETSRQVQSAVANRALALLAARPTPPAAGPRLLECLSRVTPPPSSPPVTSSIDVGPLWREVCANPDDIGARSVLGDALIEAGDPRGDVIVMQCNARQPGRPLRGRRVAAISATDGNPAIDGHDGRVKTLIRKHWHVWLGDLGLAVVRRGSEFRCGLLEVARIGTPHTPPWVFLKASEHRELCAVHTVRPAWISPVNFAVFATSLPRFPHTLGVDHPVVFEELDKRKADFARLRRLEIMPNPVTDNRTNPPTGWRSQPLRTSLLRIASLVPGLRELHIADIGVAREIANVAPDIDKLFPRIELATVSRKVVGTGYVFGASRFQVID